jgi:hypothetical protein
LSGPRSWDKQGAMTAELRSVHTRSLPWPIIQLFVRTKSGCRKLQNAVTRCSGTRHTRTAQSNLLAHKFRSTTEGTDVVSFLLHIVLCPLRFPAETVPDFWCFFPISYTNEALLLVHTFMSLFFPSLRCCNDSMVVMTDVKKGKVVPLRSIEAYFGERRYSSYSFLTSALEGGEWSASRPGRALPQGKEPTVPIVQEAGWAPEPVWRQRLEEKSSASVGDRIPAVQSVVRHCTDWATPAPYDRSNNNNNNNNNVGGGVFLGNISTGMST